MNAKSGELFDRILYTPGWDLLGRDIAERMATYNVTTADEARRILSDVRLENAVLSAFVLRPRETAPTPASGS